MLREIESFIVALHEKVKSLNYASEQYLIGNAERISKLFDDTSSHIKCFETDDNVMRHFGILKNSIIVVDRNKDIKAGQIIVCKYNGEWMVRKLCLRNDRYYLCISDGMDGCIPVMESLDLFGVVIMNCLPLN